MSDSTGSNPPEGKPPGGEPSPSEPYGRPPQQQPPAYPPPHPSPYGQPPGQQPAEPYGQPAQPQGPPPQPYGQPPQPYGQPQAPYGQPPYGQQSYAGQQYGQPPYGHQPWAVPGKRPGTITAAGVLTLLFSGLTLVLLVVAMIVISADPSGYLDGMRDSGSVDSSFSDDFLLGFSRVLMIIGMVWCVLAGVLAVFAMRRSNGARIGLVVSAAICAAVSLLLILSVVTIVTLIAAIVTIVCLFAGGAGQWYGTRGPGSGRGGMAPVA